MSNILDLGGKVQPTTSHKLSAQTDDCPKDRPPWSNNNDLSMAAL